MGRSGGPGVALVLVQTSGVGVPPGPLPGSTGICLPLWAVCVKKGFFLKFLLELEIHVGAGAGRRAKMP